MRRHRHGAEAVILFMKAHSCPHSICKQHLPCALHTQRRFFHANQIFSAHSGYTLAINTHMHVQKACGTPLNGIHSRWCYHFIRSPHHCSMASFCCDLVISLLLLLLFITKVFASWTPPTATTTKGENQKSKYLFLSMHFTVMIWHHSTQSLFKDIKFNTWIQHFANEFTFGIQIEIENETLSNGTI